MTKHDKINRGHDGERSSSARAPARPCAGACGPKPLDEYVEDLIDPGYGSYSSRQIVRESADKMLAGFRGMLWQRERQD